MGVLASAVSRSADSSGVIPCDVNRAALPTSTVRPSTTVSMPRPGTDWKRVGLINESPRAIAACVTAAASGCSEACSADAESRRSSSDENGLTGTTSVTVGRPAVKVPVLSKAMVATLCRRSSAAPLVIRMPARAAAADPNQDRCRCGEPEVAGQAMIRTDTVASTACASRVSGGARRYQAAKVIAARTRTTGTNTPATRSARCWIGAFDPEASRTRRMICCKTVSAPTRSARKRNVPVALSVPPVTRSPGFFCTGIGSPVSIDSSTFDDPSTRTPSAGMDSPGRTRTRSPVRSSSIGTSSSRPSRSTRAVLGRKATSADRTTRSGCGPGLQQVAEQDERHNRRGDFVIDRRGGVMV